jgi:glycosyltransferase involved in cell wall biosynthesis
MTTKAQAVVVTPDPTSRSGGTERFCRQLATVLETCGFEVALVAPAPAPTVLARQGAGFLWQARSVRRWVDEAELVVTSGFLGWPSRGRGRRIHVFVGNMVRLARLQGGCWHWRLRWGLAGGLAEALAARRAAVVAGSEQAAEDAARFYRAKVEAILPLGVDTDVFRPRDRAAARHRLNISPDVRYSLFVGRGEPGKGPDTALEASRLAGFTLLSAGARPPSGGLALGVLGDEELAWAYAAADAVVLPTRYEGFGYAAVEALACGVPVITTATGWARELGRDVPEYRPFLVPPEPAAVAAALGRVGSGELDAATTAARRHVLRHNTLPAFEQRWTRFLQRREVLAG